MVNKWERLNNAEIMRYEVAHKAAEIANFFRNIVQIGYDTYATEDFGGYAEAALRGYQSHEQAWEDVYITTTHDLHYAKCSSYGLYDFERYLTERWKEYFAYALKKDI